jgi:hypothetical protein
MDPVLLPWSWPGRLVDARAYRVATTRPDGCPHTRARLRKDAPPGGFGWVSDQSGLVSGAAFAGTATRWRLTG